MNTETNWAANKKWGLLGWISLHNQIPSCSLGLWPWKGKTSLDLIIYSVCYLQLKKLNYFFKWNLVLLPWSLLFLASTKENLETHLPPPKKPYHIKTSPSCPAPRNIQLKVLKFLRDTLFQRQESTSKKDHHPLLLPQGRARKQAENKPPQPPSTHLAACQPKSPRTARSAASYPQACSWRRSPRSCGACSGAGAGARPRGARSPLLPPSPPWCWRRHGPSHRRCPCGPWRTWGGQSAWGAQRWTRIWKRKEVKHKASWESASKL